MNKKRLYLAAAALLALAAILLGIRAYVLLTPTPTTVQVAEPTPSASSTALAADEPTSTPTAPPLPASRLSIVATAELAYSSTLTPPDFTNVFQLVDDAHGYYRTGGTTYLVAHSYAKGSGAPGNAWEALVVGDVFAQGGSLWQVDLVATPGNGNGDIAAQPVWTNDPDLIVLITCLSRGPGNPATNNYVIRGHRVG